MGRRLALAAAAALALAGGLAVVARSGGGDDRPTKVRTLAPAIVLGDLDAVVVSTAYDEDGARRPLPTEVRDAIAAVPGVRSASGVLQTFAAVPAPAREQAPRKTPLLFSYHEDQELDLRRGRLPEAADEVVVNADMATRARAEPGTTLHLTFHGSTQEVAVVGTFELPGVDTTGMPLVATSAAHPMPVPSVDRIDVTYSPDADPVAVEAAIAEVLGPETALLSPTALGYEDQRLAQLEIQRAYWDTLDPDDEVRQASHADPPPDLDAANAAFKQFASQTQSAELRVERVSFLSPDDAVLTYRIYYGGGPSPAFPEPQEGEAVRVDGRWKVAGSTQCNLATLIALPCNPATGHAARPPTGWKDAASLDPALASAFAALVDPNGSVDARMAAVAGADRDLVAAGLAHDRRWAGKVRAVIVGWRGRSPAVEVLYAVNTTGGGPTTPYPQPASTTTVDGTPRFATRYACGLDALAGRSCGTEAG